MPNLTLLLLANLFRRMKKGAPTPSSIDPKLIATESEVLREIGELITQNVDDIAERELLLRIAAYRALCRVYLASPSLRSKANDRESVRLMAVCILALRTIEAYSSHNERPEGQPGANDGASNRSAGDYTSSPVANSRSERATPAIATRVSTIPREGFVPGALAARLQISTSTLARYADRAQVVRPKRGEKSKPYPLEDIQKIATTMIAMSPRDFEKATELLLEIDALLLNDN